MKKNKYTLLLGLMAIALSAPAQTADKWSGEALPQAGDMAFGISINPIAAAKSVKPDASGNFVGNTIMNLEDEDNVPHQMFFLAQDPMVSIRMKYMLKEHMAFRCAIGFSGGVLNYREYVRDDVAYFNDNLSEQVVTDRIRSNYTGGGVSAGLEFSSGKRLRFVGGFGLLYSFGGGDMQFSYGNTITAYNAKPTCMDKITTINDFVPNSHMTYARPIKQYNVGISHGIGISADLGIEWFFIPSVSLGANVSMVPLMVAFQPQTYTVYEGINSFNEKKEQYNKLVSPGSSYLLYGTDNISLSLQMHYYF